MNLLVSLLRGSYSFWTAECCGRSAGRPVAPKFLGSVKAEFHNHICWKSLVYLNNCRIIMHGDIDREVVHNIVFVGWWFILFWGCCAYTLTQTVSQQIDHESEPLFSAYRPSHPMWASHSFSDRALNMDKYLQSNANVYGKTHDTPFSPPCSCSDYALNIIWIYEKMATVLLKKWFYNPGICRNWSTTGSSYWCFTP